MRFLSNETRNKVENTTSYNNIPPMSSCRRLAVDKSVRYHSTGIMRKAGNHQKKKYTAVASREQTRHPTSVQKLACRRKNPCLRLAVIIQNVSREKLEITERKKIASRKVTGHPIYLQKQAWRRENPTGLQAVHCNRQTVHQFGHSTTRVLLQL